jgi:uncharacterized membrane protein
MTWYPILAVLAGVAIAGLIVAIWRTKGEFRR